MRDFFSCYTIDFETTGVDPTVAHPLEVALVSPSGDAVFNTLLQCEIPIPPETSAVHHICDEDLEGAPHWAIIKESLANFCAPSPENFLSGELCILVAHNAEYEQGILGTEFVPVDWICTYKCALRVWPDAPGHKNEVLRYWLKLGEDRGRCGDQHPHSALHDCQVTRLLLKELFKHATLEQLLEWSKLPAKLPRMPLGKHYNQTWDTIPYPYLKWLVGQADMRPDVKFCAKEEMERRYSTHQG